MYRIALMSDTAAQDIIPSLSLLSHKVHVFPLDTAHTALESEAFDLLMVDARTALVQARQCAQLLRAAGVQLPLIALLNEGGMAAVAASWQVDDIVSDQASPSEMDDCGYALALTVCPAGTAHAATVQEEQASTSMQQAQRREARPWND